jgi:hypothetical protein
LNSLLNLRLCIFHLPLHETPKLGVHETGGRPRRAVSYSDRDETDDELMRGRWGLKGIVSAIDAPNKRNLSSAWVLCLFFREKGGLDWTSPQPRNDGFYVARQVGRANGRRHQAPNTCSTRLRKAARRSAVE